MTSERFSYKHNYHTDLGCNMHILYNHTYKPTPRSSLKAASVLLPLLGITWTFGALAINSSTVAFQYVFALLNSSQVRHGWGREAHKLVLFSSSFRKYVLTDPVFCLLFNAPLSIISATWSVNHRFWTRQSSD